MVKHLPLRPTLLATLSLSLALLLLMLLQGGLASQASIPAADVNHADVVVDLGDGAVIMRRITFTTAGISGLEALQRTGLDLAIADFSFGSFVCGIENVGCPVADCFCNLNQYWNYQHWQGDAWQSYPVGASDTLVANGAVEGWAWGPDGSAPPAVTPPLLAAQAGLQWLRPQQDADGSYGHHIGATLDTLLAVAAANQPPSRWRNGLGQSLLRFVRTEGLSFARRSAASAGKLALAVAAADQDPRDFAGANLVVSMTHFYSPTTGAFGGANVDQAFSILGWRAAGEPVPAAAVQFLIDSANADGGWGWLLDSVSDVDTTALALQALVAADQPLTATAILDGLAYLHATQGVNDDGGFPHLPDLPWAGASNSNSSAFAVQGLLAAGQDPLSAAWMISNTHPISYLLGQQLPDGAFAYIDPPGDLYATQQAIPALVGKPFPYLSRAVALRNGVDWIADQQQPDGSFAGFGPGATIDAMLALVAAGQDPAHFVSSAGATPLDYLRAQAAAYAAQNASAAGKLTVGAAAAGASLADFGGIDLVAQVESYYEEATGQYGAGSTWEQAWAMLGLAAAQAIIPPDAIQHLESLQTASGGWGFEAGATADPDSTALALQALAAAGASRASSPVQDGLAFLRSVQNPDGGFPGYGGATSASSTGLGLQALAAFGENPRSLHWTANSGLALRTPIDALLALQSTAGGFAGPFGGDDPFSTYQAAPGIAGRALPLAPLSRLHLPLIVRS